jgi:hypothetical protein
MWLQVAELPAPVQVVFELTTVMLR